MNDSLASQQKSKKTGGDVLSARLLYLALKCPLLQGKHCQTETVRPVEPQPVKTVKPPRKDDALVACFSVYIHCGIFLDRIRSSSIQAA